MLKRLRSLQEQCRSRPPLPERPFYNIGHTPERHAATPTPAAIDSDTALQSNFVDTVPHVSTPKPNSDPLSSDCADVAGRDDQDLPSATEKSSKRLRSDVDGVSALPSVDGAASPTLLSPARKRSRQDTDTSVVSESIANAAADAANADVAKSPAVISSPAEKSVDSTNVELSLVATCEPCTASSTSAAFVFGRSGSCTQLNSLSRPTSGVRSANSSPRTWTSRRDLGRVVFSRMLHDYRFHQSNPFLSPTVMFVTSVY